MIVKFNKLDRFERPKITLCNPGATYDDGYLTKVIGALHDYDSEEIVFNFNSTSELNFRLYRTKHDYWAEENHSLMLYRATQNRRLLFVDDIGFFMITNITDGYDGGVEYKDVSATSIDAELEQRMVPYIENGTYPFRTNIDGDGLLDIIVETIPLWTIGTVDQNVASRWRTFEDVDLTLNCLSFFLQNMQDAYECIFVFDCIERTINVYDQNNYVVRTNIHITKDDLINSLTVQEDANNVYTAISTHGNDNVTIAAVNPLGTNTIYNFSYFYDWMPSALKSKVQSWQAAIESVRSSYYNLNLSYYEELTTLNTLSLQVQSLNSLINVYQRLRDNIVAGSSEYALAEYNRVLTENGATSITITDDIDEMLDEIDDLIAGYRSDIDDATDEIASGNETLDGLEDQIEAYQSSLSMNTYFTSAELEELYFYIYEGTYTDEYVIITDSMSYSDRFAQMKLLYDRAASQLAKVSVPTQQFDVGVENFIFEKKFAEWSEQLETGCLINVELEQDNVAALFLTNITINYDDHSLTMTFGNRFNKFDPKSLFENVLGQINRSANSVSYLEDAIYPIKSQFNYMREQIQASRDLTMDAALASANEEVIIDGAGYTGRQKTGDGTYDPRQVKLTGKSLVFTDDAWESCKVAIGQIVVGNDTAYGINAETIIGDIIIGNELHIKDNNGNDLFTAIDGRISALVTDVNSAVTDTTNYYCVKAEGVIPFENDVSWSTTYPTRETGQHIWRKTVITYGSGATVTKAIEDITGDKGNDGASGDSGISVVSVVFQYALCGSDINLSEIIQPGDQTYPGEDAYASVAEWSNTPQEYIDGYLYWRRAVITYSDGTIEYGTPVAMPELKRVWEETLSNKAELTITNGTITGLTQRVETIDGNTTSRIAEFQQSMDGFKLRVDSIEETESGHYKEFESRVSATERDIRAELWKDDIQTAMTTLSEEGLTVSTPASSDSESTINGDGLIVTKTIVDSEGDESKVLVAEFTKYRAYTRDLVVATFASFGAHRVEAIQGYEWDYIEGDTTPENLARITEGTGYAWVGKQTELVSSDS